MTVKPRTNYILDLALLILLIVVLGSGLLLWVVYPQGGSGGGSEGGRGQGRGRNSAEQTAEHSEPVEVAEPREATTLLSLNRGDMRTIHNWSGLGMGTLMLVHVVFHLKWLLCQTRRLAGQRQPRARSATIVEETAAR